MQILASPTPNLQKKNLGMGPSDLCFLNPSRGILCLLMFENHCWGMVQWLCYFSGFSPAHRGNPMHPPSDLLTTSQAYCAL